MTRFSPLLATIVMVACASSAQLPPITAAAAVAVVDRDFWIRGSLRERLIEVTNLLLHAFSRGEKRAKEWRKENGK